MAIRLAKIKFKTPLSQIAIGMFLVFVNLTLVAQTDTIPAISTSVGVDLVSHYIWRGQDYGHVPSIQPGLSATWNDFTLGFWGAFRIAGSGDHEADLYIEKAIGPATFSIWDYWSFGDSTSTNYFNYNKQTTVHLMEAQVMLSGGEKLPFNLVGSYLFYGADPSKSIYFELQYLHSFGKVETQVFAGFQAKGEFYAPQAAFVNVGCTASKSFTITKNWKVPLSLSFIVNPDNKKAYLVAGITILDF
jgi:hypothetical protein